MPVEVLVSGLEVALEEEPEHHDGAVDVLVGIIDARVVRGVHVHDIDADGVELLGVLQVGIRVAVSGNVDVELVLALHHLLVVGGLGAAEESGGVDDLLVHAGPVVLDRFVGQDDLVDDAGDCCGVEPGAVRGGDVLDGPGDLGDREVAVDVIDIDLILLILGSLDDGFEILDITGVDDPIDVRIGEPCGFLLSVDDLLDELDVLLVDPVILVGVAVHPQSGVGVREVLLGDDLAHELAVGRFVRTSVLVLHHDRSDRRDGYDDHHDRCDLHLLIHSITSFR